MQILIISIVLGIGIFMNVPTVCAQVSGTSCGWLARGSESLPIHRVSGRTETAESLWVSRVSGQTKVKPPCSLELAHDAPASSCKCGKVEDLQPCVLASSSTLQRSASASSCRGRWQGWR